MTAPTLAPTLPITSSVLGDQRFSLTWNESVNRTTVSRLMSVLESLDGVSFVEPFVDDLGVYIGVIPSFADIYEISRVAVIKANQVLTDTPPMQVKIKVGPFDGKCRVVETNFKHSDTRLLVALLRQFDFNEVTFSQNGYNVVCYCGRTRILDTVEGRRQLKEAINDFYAGRLPRPDLNYVRTDAPSGTNTSFTWLLNRRLTAQQIEALTPQFLSAVEGLTGLVFTSNGHEVTGSPANSFFPKNRLALQVMVLIEQFFEKLEEADELDV